MFTTLFKQHSISTGEKNQVLNQINDVNSLTQDVLWHYVSIATSDKLTTSLIVTGYLCTISLIVAGKTFLRTDQTLITKAIRFIFSTSYFAALLASVGIFLLTSKYLLKHFL